MNEDVENVFNGMFAPNPIPQRVIDFYERVNYLKSRIDAPNKISLLELCMIAAHATDTPATPVPKVPPQQFVDTTEKEKQTEEETPPPAGHGPKGPMDAPSKPPRKDNKLIEQLQAMSAPEVREHAKSVLNINFPTNMNKKTMISKIRQQQRR